MATETQPTKIKPAKGSAGGVNNGDGKKELKILMLHGFTQSGPLFHAKTAALNKLLAKAFAASAPPHDGLRPVFIYPTGPHRLRPSDVPGYVPAAAGTQAEAEAEAEAEERAEDASDNWAWFRRDESRGGAYVGLDRGMRAIAAEMVAAGGGVDGVLGFSQGGAMAALVAAALEPQRAVPGQPSSPSAAGIASGGETGPGPGPGPAHWAEALRVANGHRPLRFCVIYSGFYARDEELAWLYGGEGGIRTPTLHFLGGLDTVVEESRSLALAERCRDAQVVTHPGGHFVPVSKQWAGVLVGFLRDVFAKETEEGGRGGADDEVDRGLL